MTTQIPEIDMLYDFSEEQDAVVPPPPPPDPGVPKEPEPKPEPAQVQTADIVALDLMRTGRFTIAIQLLPHDNDPAGRVCTIGVQLDKQAPTITAIRGSELGVLPGPIWQLMEAQAQLAATKPAAAKKKEEIPPPLTAKTKPAPAAKVAPAPAPTPAPAPAAAAAQNDIYSLFDL